MSHLVVIPKVALADEPLRIQVSGLGPNQLVTLRASLTDEKGVLFQSKAFYRADNAGNVDLDRAGATGGDFNGVIPMGLLWFLRPEKRYRQLVKRDVMGSPFHVRFDLYDSFHMEQVPDVKPLDSQTVERWYVKPGVQRILIKEGRVRGALFLPPGSGTFPGVIDMSGGTGGLVEYRASLLASHGFATLALPYFGYDDLPRTVEQLDLEYFEEAADLLLAHPKVRGPGIGVVGSSKGAELGLAMAAFLNQVSAVVSINGRTALYGTRLRYRGRSLQGAPYCVERTLITDTGALVSRGLYGAHREEAHAGAAIPMEKATGSILFVVGEQDQSCNSAEFAAEALVKMRMHGKQAGELLTYPGAGHLFEPPGTPLCRETLMGRSPMPLAWGGEEVAHARAQEHAWCEIQNFLHKHIGKAGSSRL
ncbi:acyl-coenzyme A amino acid N-acyltransferase 1-like [Ambystoma mexicanum]|uniref:acyl-coenzyme A amino acid N-acyltransferase 1-like n=1 Tax=Ambystoma mexicanum TaxID=8296 RepID=UPI0037E88FA0